MDPKTKEMGSKYDDDDDGLHIRLQQRLEELSRLYYLTATTTFNKGNSSVLQRRSWFLLQLKQQSYLWAWSKHQAPFSNDYLSIQHCSRLRRRRKSSTTRGRHKPKQVQMRKNRGAKNTKGNNSIKRGFVPKDGEPKLANQMDKPKGVAD